ncbi:MAG: NYN domain-containing protein [Bacteroidetes bacterium]|nr:NYN domain-containing protein [Bacteroidota bacterium]
MDKRPAAKGQDPFANGVEVVFVYSVMEYKRTYVDGYNLLHKISRLERLMKSNPDAARRGLVEFVRKRMRGKGQMIVVFDGHGEVIGAGTAISVVFSLTRTADDWIRFNLEQDRQPRMALVVSSDNEVRAHAAVCGAHLMSAQEFISDQKREKSDMVEMHLKNRPLTDSEIQYWLDQFEKGG